MSSYEWESAADSRPSQGSRFVQHSHRSQLLTEKEVRKRIPVGHSKYYELITSGELRSVKIGRRRFVSETAVAEYISRLEANG